MASIAQRVLSETGVFAIEAESRLKLHPWHKPSHLAELQTRVGAIMPDIPARLVNRSASSISRAGLML